MINNIFEFSNKKAEEIMTHRMELVGISANIELRKLINIIKEEKCSRIPVYDESFDNVIGILHVKDLLTLTAEYDDEKDKELKRIDETTFEVSGMINLNELEEHLDVKLPVEAYETLNDS